MNNFLLFFPHLKFPAHRPRGAAVNAFETADAFRMVRPGDGRQSEIANFVTVSAIPAQLLVAADLEEAEPVEQ